MTCILRQWFSQIREQTVKTLSTINLVLSRHGKREKSSLSVDVRSRRLEVVGERENGRARGRHAKGSLSPRVSPSRAPVFSRAHYFQAPATQATLPVDVRRSKTSLLTLPNSSARGA